MCGHHIHNGQESRSAYLHHILLQTQGIHLKKLFNDFRECFKDGWKSCESDPCSGRPSLSKKPENFEHVLSAINEN